MANSKPGRWLFWVSVVLMVVGAWFSLAIQREHGPLESAAGASLVAFLGFALFGLWLLFKLVRLFTRSGRQLPADR
jgi:hypothetical protein